MCSSRWVRGDSEGELNAAPLTGLNNFYEWSGEVYTLEAPIATTASPAYVSCLSRYALNEAHGRYLAAMVRFYGRHLS